MINYPDGNREVLIKKDRDRAFKIYFYFNNNALCAYSTLEERRGSDDTAEGEQVSISRFTEKKFEKLIKKLDYERFN